MRTLIRATCLLAILLNMPALAQRVSQTAPAPSHTITAPGLQRPPVDHPEKAAGTIEGFVYWDASHFSHVPAGSCSGLAVTVSVRNSSSSGPFPTYTTLGTLSNNFKYVGQVKAFLAGGKIEVYEVCTYGYDHLPAGLDLQVKLTVTQPGVFAPVAVPKVGILEPIQISNAQCNMLPRIVNPTFSDLAAHWSSCQNMAYDVNFMMVAPPQPPLAKSGGGGMLSASGSVPVEKAPGPTGTPLLKNPAPTGTPLLKQSGAIGTPSLINPGPINSPTNAPGATVKAGSAGGPMNGTKPGTTAQLNPQQLPPKGAPPVIGAGGAASQPWQNWSAAQNPIEPGGSAHSVLCSIAACPQLKPAITGYDVTSVFTPGGKLVLQGTNFNSPDGQPGSIVLKIGSKGGLTVAHPGTGFRQPYVERQVTVLGWADSHVSGQIPRDISGVMDGTATVEVWRHDGVKSDPFAVQFKATKDLQILPITDVTVSPGDCYTSTNLNLCNNWSDSSQLTIPSDIHPQPSIFGAHILFMDVYKVRIPGHDMFNFSLENGWELANVVSLGNLAPFWAPYFPPEVGVQYFSPKDSVKVKVGAGCKDYDDAYSIHGSLTAGQAIVGWDTSCSFEYYAYIHITGPKGVPWK